MANLQIFQTSLFYTFCFLLACFFVSGSTARVTNNLQTRDIPGDASSANAVLLPVCPRPNGNTYVAQISNPITDTQGFIARDDRKKEIVISFRATITLQDEVFTDARISLVPMHSPGVVATGDILVHEGFRDAWNSVASFVLDTVQSELANHPGYSIVTTGHSLGGALSSLAAITLKANLPNVTMNILTPVEARSGCTHMDSPGK
ncbi:hypothetical protein CVT25_007318 [Psilocybe cyanescens]|uniref:Fungal lipase-type domain-containing protein n=1 Tax=Psilocybe cyanescens TaxID=93625 RepID=A0A409XMY1_PSICY|nr:hypothetical protein CVT25_007318 [Psilocybe cyanescens]